MFICMYMFLYKKCRKIKKNQEKAQAMLLEKDSVITSLRARLKAGTSGGTHFFNFFFMICIFVIRSSEGAPCVPVFIRAAHILKSQHVVLPLCVKYSRAR